MTFDELIEKLKLRAGQLITQTWYDRLAEALEMIKEELNIGGRLSFSKLPDGALGKVLIAQGEGKDPVYADPDCNIIKVAGTDLTPRDWSQDFAKLPDLLTEVQNTRVEIENILQGDIKTAIQSLQEDVNEGIAEVSEKLNSIQDVNTSIQSLISLLTPSLRLSLSNIGITAGEDILEENLTATSIISTIRIYVSFDTNGILSVVRYVDNHEIVEYLNSGTELNSDSGYTFDIPIEQGEEINFRYSVNATLSTMKIIEIKGVIS